MPQITGNEVDPECLLKHFNMNSNKRPQIIRSMMRFDCFYEKVVAQPLSSFIRAMELKCRSLSPVFDNLFNIDYVKYNGEIGLGAFMHNTGDAEERENISKYAIDRFRISIPSSANEADTRDIMAHELGHLYNAVVALEDKFKRVDEDSAYRTEKQKMLRVFLINYMKKSSMYFDDDANVIASFILNKRVVFCKGKARTEKALNRHYERIVMDLKKLKTSN